jgi:hypothetical protein
MVQINNNQLSEFTTHHRQFETNTGSVYANDSTSLYVVYSYGEHFPIYIHDYTTHTWFGNSDKYSPTTTRHQTLARPDADHINMLTTEDLNALIDSGSYTAYCADRCIGHDHYNPPPS